MGLDITVYPEVTVIEKHECKPHSDDCYDLGHVATYAYKDFTQSFRGLPILSEDDQFIHGPWVLGTMTGWGFRAGSYSGYNAWRSSLMTYAWGTDVMDYDNLDKYRELPFFELIWFADNEGTIGPEACADLFQDFEAQAEAVRFANDEYFLEKYKEWHGAFRDTAGTGIVDFH